MAEEITNNETKNEGEDTSSQNSAVPFYINDQYIKDLSFENPNFLLKYQENVEQPQVSVNVETTVGKLRDTHYEVVMKVNVKSFIKETDVFVLELAYGALVTIDPNLQSDVLEPILLVHCPFLMFPFLRNIVSDMSKHGGYAPLLIEPIDFASLYMEKKQKEIVKAEESSEGSRVKN
jgi:preprotein translocase subunit SecB